MSSSDLYKTESEAHNTVNQYLHDCREAGEQPDSATLQRMNDTARDATMKRVAAREADTARHEQLSPEQKARERQAFLDQQDQLDSERRRRNVEADMRAGGVFRSPSQEEADKAFRGNRHGASFINGQKV